MAAPSAGPPVTVTVGAVWTFDQSSSPPPTPEFAVVVVISWIGLAVVRFYFGVAYFLDCPQQPIIPIYLIGLVFIPLLLSSLMVLPCDENRSHQERLRGFRACLKNLSGLFMIVWFVLGDVWIFSIYQPNYEPTAADGLYCDKTLYTFALWNAVFETFGIGFLLVRPLKGLLCFVNMSPAPRDADFYGRV